MNRKNYGLIFLSILSFGCSERPDKSAPALTDAEEVRLKHEQITQQSILADFVEAIAEDRYESAFASLHPTRSTAWTLARFSRDWKNIKALLPSEWKAEATESFSGRSPQGPYEQAVFRLGPDPKASASLELTSMRVDGKSRIVKIYVRLPPSTDIPEPLAAHGDAFVTAMLQNNFPMAQTLFSESAKIQYPSAVLSRIRPFLGENQESTEMFFYRLLANAVWYDVILLKQINDPASHLELILSGDDSGIEIVSLNFKGRM